MVFERFLDCARRMVINKLNLRNIVRAEKSLRDLASGHPVNHLLYITPEKLCTAADFMQILTTVEKQKEDKACRRLQPLEASCAPSRLIPAFHAVPSIFNV